MFVFGSLYEVKLCLASSALCLRSIELECLGLG
jgi:hypothetical protein